MFSTFLDYVQDWRFNVKIANEVFQFWFVSETKDSLEIRYLIMKMTLKNKRASYIFRPLFLKRCKYSFVFYFHSTRYVNCLCIVRSRKAICFSIIGGYLENCRLCNSNNDIAATCFLAFFFKWVFDIICYYFMIINRPGFTY